jgi:hypothetical protein
MSILTGVITWWITRSRERLDETRRMQRELLTQLIANRHDLKGELFTQALNGCAVVFAESLAVKDAICEFHARVTADQRTNAEIEGALLRVIRAMIDYLGLQLGNLPDEFLLTPFNTRSNSIPASGSR